MAIEEFVFRRLPMLQGQKLYVPCTNPSHTPVGP